MEDQKVAVTKMGWHCFRCGYDWIPKMKGTPHTCPKCKSVLWNEPKGSRHE